MIRSPGATGLIAWGAAAEAANVDKATASAHARCTIFMPPPGCRWRDDITHRDVGEWLPDGGYIVSKPEIERVFALQRAHQWQTKASTADQRKAKLQKLKAAVEAHGDQIVAAVRQDTRKPENEVRITELLNVLANIDRNIANLDQWMQPVEVSPSLNKNDKARIVYEARGVCLILGPWNFPLGLVMGPLAAAIGAGNCCIVKISDLCPASARVAASIIRDAYDENEVALFEGGVDVATALLELPFNHIFFTGSTRVGKLVMAAAAKNLASVTLELGGKSPVIVDADADIKKVAGDLAHAKQFNGGQACVCPDYVFITPEQ
jgi:aldehyde dehydrogenase (NAD+)